MTWTAQERQRATLERQLQRAAERGDRIAALQLSQRLWAAGDLRRAAIVTLRSAGPEEVRGWLER